MTATKDTALEGAKHYELGLLLSPLLPEEAVTGWLNGAAKTMLERRSATIETTETPKMIALAYPIRKRLDNKNQVFREAYFTAIRFTALPEEMPALKEDIRKMSEVIRSLLIIVPKVTEMVVERREKATSEAAKEDKSELPTESASPVSLTDTKEVIDREIDDLLVAPTNE